MRGDRIINKNGREELSARSLQKNAGNVYFSFHQILKRQRNYA